MKNNKQQIVAPHVASNPRKIRVKVILDEKQREVMKRYLMGEYTTREASEQWGFVSHQTIINVAARLAMDWYKEKKIDL